MEEYYIYKLSPTFIPVAKQFPRVIHYMAHIKKEGFAMQQYNLAFCPHEELDLLLKNHFNHRKDYTYKKNIHYLRNQLTGDSSLVVIHERCIYVKYTRKFDIMLNIILQSDSKYVILNR